jgi:hypothetical protein
MKGIVAELDGKKAVILAQDGTFIKIRASANMSAGSEVDINQPAANARVIRLAARVSSIAAAALFAVGVSYGAYCYTLPYSYVDVDMNPSVELTANVYDRIIKVEALNEDGKKLITDHNLNNTRLDDGVSQLLNIAVEQGYLKPDTVIDDDNINTTPAAIQPGDDNKSEEQTDPAAETVVENAILLTVSSTDAIKSAELKKKIVKKASEELSRRDINSDVLAGEASVRQHDEARVLGVTPGKLALIEDAMQGQPGLKLEKLKKSAVTDLVKKARAKKAADNNVSRKAAELKKAQELKRAQELKKVHDARRTREEAKARVEQERANDNVQEPKNGSVNSSEEKAKKAQEDKRAQEAKNAREDKRNQALKKAREKKEANAAVLEEEKKQRRRLKDELLEQIQLQEQERRNKKLQEESIKQQEKNSNIKSNQENAKKGIPQKEGNVTKKGKDYVIQDRFGNRQNIGNSQDTGKRAYGWGRQQGN